MHIEEEIDTISLPVNKTKYWIFSFSSFKWFSVQEFIYVSDDYDN